MRTNPNRAGQRGQVIVAAIAILFLLAFIASIFLVLISRNLNRAGRGSDVTQAQYLAEAGIRYADSLLTNSAEGADWRPEPHLNPNPEDPDYAFLKAGYTRFNQGNGRFLLRVSYQPVVVNDNGEPVDVNGNPTDDVTRMGYPALGRYIKIEAIGRRGVVDSNDPTTWRSKDPLRRMLVAYKPIGITDYVRFVTNKDRSSNTIVLGATPFPLEDGKPFRTYWNGPIRVNGDLMWSGLNTINLNGMENYGGDVGNFYSPTLQTTGIVRDDAVEVAGRIFHDGLPDGISSNDQIRLINASPDAVTKTVDCEPSILPNGNENPNFDTATGTYRDGSAAGSATGRVRGVTRVEPPNVDQTDPATGILRYRLLTRNSGYIPKGKNYNIGQYGLGQGIYVDNGNEIQRDTVFRKLTDEWARTGTGRGSEADPQSAWRQHLYTPPGAEVYLDPSPGKLLNSAFPNGQSQGTIIITRHDGRQWRDENGRDEGFSRRYRYPLRAVYDNTGQKRDSETYDGGDQFRDRTGAYKTFQNGVMYFEGNVRIQGKLPADWQGSSGQPVGAHLTIITNGTAYIEGNLLKGDAVGGSGSSGLQMGSIAILAKDYVCVNSTAYFMKQPDAAGWSYAIGNPFTELGSAGQTYVTSGYSAVDPARYPEDSRGARQCLHFLQTAESFPGGAADVTMQWYGGGNLFSWGSIYRQGGSPVPMLVSPGMSSLSPAENVWQHHAIPLSPTLHNGYQTSWSALGTAAPDWFVLTYRPFFGPSQYDNSSPGTQFAQNYAQPIWISRTIVSPMDVRIEAVLYAQEGSFFVIPGEWANGNKMDLRGDNLNNSLRYQNPMQAGWRLQDLANGRSSYPFHQEPPDIRVVINGAVAENMPASKEYQTAWAKHWGWTPKVRPDGSNSPHGGEGLVYTYDHNLRLPIRRDRYNRPLPPMPALPVSPDLIFFGEAS
jgi:hypothetical protein